MKKIAFILALVMVFAVALVACDEAPAESSTPETESTPAESTPVESEDESVPAESEPAENVEASVISEGKSYTYTESGLYYITWDETWAVSKNAAACLTDGVTIGENVYYGDKTLIGWGGDSDIPVVTIDLGEEKSVSGVTYFAYGGMDGIAVPMAVTVEVSADGETWTEVTCLSSEVNKTVSELSWASTGFISEFELTPTAEATARFVKLTFTKEGSFVFLTEIQVTGK